MRMKTMKIDISNTQISSHESGGILESRAVFSQQPDIFASQGEITSLAHDTHTQAVSSLPDLEQTQRANSRTNTGGASSLNLSGRNHHTRDRQTPSTGTPGSRNSFMARLGNPGQWFKKHNITVPINLPENAPLPEYDSRGTPILHKNIDRVTFALVPQSLMADSDDAEIFYQQSSARVTGGDQSDFFSTRTQFSVSDDEQLMPDDDSAISSDPQQASRLSSHMLRSHDHLQQARDELAGVPTLSFSSPSTSMRVQISDDESSDNEEPDLRNLHTGNNRLHLQSQEQPLTTIPITVALGGNGKLEIEAGDYPHHAELLKTTLGRASQSYQAHEANSDLSQQLLLDHKGRTFQIEQKPIGMIVLHSSQTTAISTPDETATLKPADARYLAVATAVHQGTDGDYRRLHNGNLLVMNQQNLVWVKDSEEKYSHLSTAANGRSYAIKDDNTLVDLEQNISTTVVEGKIQSYATATDDRVAVLTKKEAEQPQRLSFLPAMNATPGQAIHVSVKYAPGQQQLDIRPSDSFEAEHIGISGNTILVVDKQKRILSAPYPQPGQTELGFTLSKQDYLTQAFGQNAAVEGFFNDSHGGLTALVRDSAKHLHAFPLQTQSDDFHPGWNLSDMLFLENTLGLELQSDLDSQQQDFGHQGQLSLAEDGTLHYRDHMSQAWQASKEKGTALQRGLDNQPYILQDGQIKKLSINMASDPFRFGEDNIFALHHTHGQPKAAASLKGLAKDQQATTMAIVNDREYVAATEDGKLHYCRTRTNGKAVSLDLPKEGLTGQVRQLQLDKNLNLYALTDDHKLYQLPRESWQTNAASRPGGQWQALEYPPTITANDALQLNRDQDHRLQLSSPDGKQLILEQDSWKETSGNGTFDPDISSNDINHDSMFDRLRDKNDRLLGNTGITVSTRAMIGNVYDATNFSEGSRFRDRLRAHLFNPTMEMPRPLKTLGSAIQHRWQGREGLRPLYQQESALYKALEAGNHNPVNAKVDLQTRLAGLDIGENGKTLLKNIEDFRAELENSAEKHLTILGKHQGVLDSDGKLNLDYRPSTGKQILQSMNIHRSEHNLSEELFTAWKQQPASADSNVGQMLKAFTELKVDMSHSKTEAPLGQQRNTSDQNALIKARLVLDIQMLKELNTLIDKAELLQGNEVTDTQLTSLESALSELRDNKYDANRIKLYTDMGMEGFKDIEAAYDIGKSFVQAFSQKDNGVNMMSKATFGANDQTELGQKMKDVVLSMGIGEEVAFSRNYAAGVGIGFIPDAMKSKLTFIPTGKAELNRSYNLKFAQDKAGIEIKLTRNLGPSTSATLGGKQKLTDSDEKPSSSSADNKEMKTEVAFSGGVSAGAVSVHHDEFILVLTQQETANFIDGLTQGTLNPEDVLAKSLEQKIMHGHKSASYMSASLKLAARVKFNPEWLQFTKWFKPKSADDTGKSTTVRMGGGIQAGVDMAEFKRDNLRYRGPEGYDRHRVTTRKGLFNGAQAGAELVADIRVKQPVDGATLVDKTGLELSGQARIDTGIRSRVEITTKTAVPLSKDDIDGVCDSIAKAFKDPASQDLIKGVRELDDISEQIHILHTHFLQQEIQNDDQYAAVRTIKSTAVQHHAASNHGDIINGTRYMVFHSNMRHLDHATLLSTLASHVSPVRQSALSAKVADMSSQDPALASLLQMIRTEPGCGTCVIVDLTDEARDRLDAATLEGKANNDLLAELYADPSNRRIKSISVNQFIQHVEGVSMPLLIAKGSSSNSIAMEKMIGAINFKYGSDQNLPQEYEVIGRIANANTDTSEAIQALSKEGIRMRRG